MSRLRFRLLLILLWAMAISISRAAGELAPLSLMADGGSIVVMLCLIGVPQLAPLPLPWLLLPPVVILFIAKLALGHPILGEGLTGTFVDTATILITTILAVKVAQSLNEFRGAVSQVMLSGLCIRPRRLRQVQGRLYREIRNARFRRQPLTLLAVSADLHDVVAQERLAEEALRALAREHLQGRVAEFLREETRDCGMIARLDHHLITVLPATAAEDAEQVVQSLRENAWERLSINLAIGSASFPEEEVTLVGLLQRANRRMRRQPGQADANNHARKTEFAFTGQTTAGNGESDGKGVR